MTDEARANLRAAWARRRALGIRSPKLGQTRTARDRQRISAGMRASGNIPRGAAHYNWKGGVTPGQRLKRKGRRYREWRAAVVRAAGGICEGCTSRHHRRMHAHHIKPIATHPELMFDTSNGAYLCDDCHREAHAD